MILLRTALLLLISSYITTLRAQQQPAKTQIMLLGSDHFSQEGLYKDAPLADLFHERRQQELKQVNDQLARFNPDLILIEREPSDQPQVDSLYSLYKSGKISLRDLAYGRSEQYQIAFALGKRLAHEHLYGIDFYSNSSNRMLNQGQGIEYYQEALKSFSELGRSVREPFRAGTTTVSAYLNALNSPSILQQTYQTMFITPAKVRNGQLNATDAALDSTRISYDYVGADFITHFYNRELRIYANLVATQRVQKKQRVLVVMGQRHAAVLTKIMENDPDYQLVRVSDYLK